MSAAAEQQERAPAEEQVPPNMVLIEAIAKRLCIEAVYNRVSVILAPHIAFTRHGDLFVDAVTLERDGKKPKEIKLGTFKLAGLVDLRLTRRLFVPLATFDRADPKYGTEMVFAVEH